MLLYYIYKSENTGTDPGLINGNENSVVSDGLIDGSEDSTVSDTEVIELSTFPLTEIFKHNSEDDCWLLIDGKVYDVTEFISEHPGGKAILEGCGKEASTLYNQREREDGTTIGSGTPHSDRAREMLKDYYIGDLE